MLSMPSFLNFHGNQQAHLPPVIAKNFWQVEDAQSALPNLARWIAMVSCVPRLFSWCFNVKKSLVGTSFGSWWGQRLTSRSIFFQSKSRLILHPATINNLHKKKHQVCLVPHSCGGKTCKRHAMCCKICWSLDCHWWVSRQARPKTLGCDSFCLVRSRVITWASLVV